MSSVEAVMCFGETNLFSFLAATLILCLTVPATCALAQSSQDKTKIRLDLDTFPFYQTRFVLQHEADRVSLAIDKLIPGQVAAYSTSDILCFVAPEAWDTSTEGRPPITLVGARRSGEPKAIRPYSVRIGLHRKVLLQNNSPEFIYELSHELAHVKMDARYDNYLVETFAVTVSLKVLKELGLNQIRRDVIDLYTRELPQPIKLAIANADPQSWGKAALKDVTIYWQSKALEQKPNPFRPWDYSLATVGALILEASQQPAWPNLLGVGSISENCLLSNGKPATAADAGEFKTCSPVILKMPKLSPALSALGLPTRPRPRH